MATRYAVSNGNWSSLSTWDGGVSLPGAGDLVYADGKTVTIDQTVNVGSIRTDQRSGGTAGGGFTLPSVQSFTANIISGTTTCLAITATGDLTITGSVTGSTTTGVNTVTSTNSLNITVTGNITGNIVNSSIAVGYGMYITGAGSFTCNGTITGGGNYAGATYRYGVYLGNATNVVVNTVIGGALTGTGTSNHGLYISIITGNITVTGNITGGSTIQSSAIRIDSTSFGTLTLNSNATIASGQTTYNVYCPGTGTYNIICNGICEGIYAAHTDGTFVSNQGATGVYTSTAIANITMTAGTHGIKASSTTNGWVGLTLNGLSGSGFFTYAGDITANLNGHGLVINKLVNLNITGNIINNATWSNTHGIVHTGDGDIIVTGTVQGSTSAAYIFNSSGIYYTGSGNITINGNAIAGNTTDGYSGIGSPAVRALSGTNITVNGSVLASSSGTAYNAGIKAIIGGTLLVTGDVTGTAIGANVIYGSFGVVRIEGVITSQGASALYFTNNPSKVTILSTPVLKSAVYSMQIIGTGDTNIDANAEILGLSSLASSGTLNAPNATYMCANQFNVGMTFNIPNVTEIRGHATLAMAGLTLVGNGSFTFAGSVIAQGGSMGINLGVNSINLNITGNITNNATGPSIHAISTTGTGTITVTGNLINTATVGGTAHVINCTTTNNIIINGNVTGGTSGTTVGSCHGICMGSGNLTVNGNVNGGTNTGNYNSGVGTGALTNLTITGNVNGGSGNLYNSGVRVTSIIGDIIVGGYVKSSQSISGCHGIWTVSTTVSPASITVTGITKTYYAATYAIYIPGTNPGTNITINGAQCEGIYSVSPGGIFSSPNAIPVATSIAANTINIKAGDIQDHATLAFYGLEIVGGTGDITINGNVKTRYGGTALNVTANRNVIINGDILVYNTISGNHGFTYSGKGNVTVTGSIYACQTPSAIASSSGLYVRTTSIGDITINGDIIGCLSTGVSAWGNGCNGLSIEGSNNVYIHGTVTGGKTPYSHGILVNSSFSGNITCYSNVYGYKGPAIYIYSGAYIVNISGDNLILPTDSAFAVNMGAASSTLNVVGDYLFKSGTIANYIYMGAGTLLNFIGNMYGPESNDTSHTNRIIDAVSATINFTGNIIANASQNSYGFIYLYANTATATINFTGNILMGSVAAKGIYLAMANTLFPAICNVTGNVYAGTGNNTYGIYSAGASIIDILGEVRSSTTSAAVYSSHINSINRIRGNYTVVGGIEPCYGSELTKWLIDDNLGQSISLTSIGGSQRVFSTSNLAMGLPPAKDVRYLTVFGPYDEYVGTLHVPDKANVELNIPVDDTLGTAMVTASQFQSILSELVPTLEQMKAALAEKSDVGLIYNKVIDIENSLGAVGETVWNYSMANITMGIGARLKNVSTVQSVLAQLTGFQL